MKNEAVVSIWLGSFNCYEDLQKYIEVKYTEDGDSIDSKFEKDFKIDYYDEDFREVNFLEKSSDSFTYILQEHSYFNSIISNYTKCSNDKLERTYNSVILVYNFSYEEKVKEIQDSNKLIEFIGSVEYDENEY